jgi:hypothetical protein
VGVGVVGVGVGVGVVCRVVGRCLTWRLSMISEVRKLKNLFFLGTFS